MLNTVSKSPLGRGREKGPKEQQYIPLEWNVLHLRFKGYNSNGPVSAHGMSYLG